MKVSRNSVVVQSELPTPTMADPHAQLIWIFRDKGSLYSNQESRKSYRTALVFYQRFLKQTHNYSKALERDPRFFLSREWDVFALHKVKAWLDATNVPGCDSYLSSYHVTNLMSVLRLTMTHAYEHSYIDKPIINVPMRQAVRETDLRTAYSLDEFERIFKVVGPMIRFSKDLLRPYVRTGVGKDPRVHDTNWKSGQKTSGDGWNCWALDKSKNWVPQDDNLRWYFENVMNCVALPAIYENHRDHQGFFRAAKTIHGGLNRAYKKWGVASAITSDVIMPLVVELAAETGLNVESVLSLKRDCFKEAHPLTGLPFLEYNKPRSGGEKELHTALYDSRSSIDLRQRQSRIIGNSIASIRKLTEPLVRRASVTDQGYLFLFEARKGTSLAAVRRLDVRSVVRWTGRIIKNFDLRADNGKRLTFTLSRFRPTKITEMVAQGHDFFDIMAIAGHSSITTTLSYIDKLRSASDFYRKIEKVLSTIKRNKENYEQQPLPIAIKRKASPGKFIFKAPICYCKNPYDPPEIVRRSKDYREGDACSYFNMCLSCENVLITETNLPRLISYRTEIDRALASVSEVPRQGELYMQTRMVLDQILTTDVFFTKETLDWATHVAAVEDYDVLDSFISRSVVTMEV